MPNKTYDDITRRTVVEPDSSFRPTPEQVEQARHGFRALDPDEQRLLDRVREVLTGHDIDVEVERDRVTLRGHVPDLAVMRRIPDLVRGIEGVGEVVDQLVLG